MKKEVYVGIFLVTFSVAYILLMSTLERPVYLSEPECGGEEGQVILRLSSGTNAHAEIASGTNYIENICYNEIFGKKYAVTNPTICDGKNLVLKLSGQTNAHAEIAFGTNYDVNVCYGDIQECELVKTGSCPLEKRAIVRLSSDTNAHLEKLGLKNYDNVICCKISSPPGPLPQGDKACNDKIDNDGDGKIDLIDPGCSDINDDDEKDIVPPAGEGRAYWADEKGVEFEKDKNKVNIGDTVTLFATGVPANAEVNFVIWDEDLRNLLNPDDKIKDGIKAKADDKGVAKSSWKITKEDYDKGGDEADKNLELYFIANAGDKDLKSDILFLGSIPIPEPEEVGCNVYKNELSCKEDKDKQFEKDSLYNTYECGKTVNKDGKKITTTCACTWENKCILKPKTTTIIPHDPGKKPCITECVPEDYKESTCDANSGLKTVDQKMTLQVVAGTDCTKEQIDEERKQCQDYSASVPCGSKRLQLPLFGFAQFMISLIMISILYALIILRGIVRKIVRKKV